MQEFVLLEVVAPLTTSDLDAEIDEHVYATDAALSTAVVSTHLHDVAKPLWLRGVKKKQTQSLTQLFSAMSFQIQSSTPTT